MPNQVRQAARLFKSTSKASEVDRIFFGCDQQLDLEPQPLMLKTLYVLFAIKRNYMQSNRDT